MGAVIGIRGDHINQVSKRSGAKNVISKNQDPTYPGTRDRIGMCVGTNEQILIAVSLILKALHESMNKKTSQGQDEKNDPVPFVLNILVPAKSAGAVIGKRGETIQKLQKDSHSSIVVARNEEQISRTTYERSIEISADALQGVLHAVGGIMEALQQGQYPSDYENKTVVYQRQREEHHGNRFEPRGRGGYDPRGDSRGDSRGGPRGDPRGYDQRGRQSGFEPRGRRGGYDSRSYDPRFDPRGGRQDPYYEDRSRGERFGGDRFRGDARDRHQPRPRTVNPMNPKTQNNTDRRGASQVVNEVQVSDDLIGRLVGKKGAHIRHLEEVTRTKITISKRNEFYRGTTNRIITIYADSAEDNATVQRMIQEAISDPEISKRSANMANGGGPDNNGDGRSRNNRQQLSGDKLMERCMQVGPGATIPSMYVVPVPDTCIGSIMGIKGVNLQKMRNETGTTIEISKRNHFFPNGMKDRILVIKGDPAQVSACQALIVGALDFPTQMTDKMKLKTFFERNPVSGGGVPSYQQQQHQQLQQHQQPMPLQQHPMPLGMPLGAGSGYYPQGVQPPPLQYHQPQYKQPQPLMPQASYHPHQQDLHSNFPSSQQQHHSYQPAPQQEFREPSLQQQSSDFVASGGQGFAGTYGTGY